MDKEAIYYKELWHKTLQQLDALQQLLSKDRLVSVETLSTLWNVEKRTIRQWQKSGYLPYYKLQKLVRFNLEEVTNIRNRGYVPAIRTGGLTNEKVSFTQAA